MKKIDSKELQLGMYVAKLDRPWLETAFPFQGFSITTQAELQELERLCRHVYIDEEKSEPSFQPTRLSTPQHSRAGAEIAAHGRPMHFKPVEEEIPAARALCQQAEKRISAMMQDTRLGKDLDIEEAKSLVNELIESITRNPDALVLLGTIKGIDMEAEAHAINTCILSLTFGRYLGIPRAQLEELGIAALLHDIGEAHIPAELLRKKGLKTAEEAKQLQRHAELGAEILRKTRGIPASAAEVAYAHHEQVNGKGYPRGLKGDELSLFARIVAIVDVYDRVTCSSNGRALPSTEALRYLYQYRDQFFDADLTEQFIQCLGIYPVGSVVELATGEVGIVISIPPESHLFPRLLLVRDKDKQAYLPPRIMNLVQFTTHDDATRYAISHVLASDAYGIDLRAYMLSESVF